MAGHHVPALGPLKPGGCHSPMIQGIIVIHRLEQRVDGKTEHLFVAFMHGQFVGSAVATVQPWRACSIRMLFVIPRARRMGVATALLGEIEEYVIKQDVEGLEIAVLKGNEPGRQFWIRKGKFIDAPDSEERLQGQARASEYVCMVKALG